jgi:2-keto-4-pentenoate hydratase/2-oxohepta-3-ene-1,7-dioic acid hydratase in catechol pathway
VGPVALTKKIDPGFAAGAGVAVETRVNGEVRQQGNTRDLIFSLAAVIRYIAQSMTLYPGDLIPTGTPAGVGPVVAGDVMEVTIEGVGTLKNSVADE